MKRTIKPGLYLIFSLMVLIAKAQDYIIIGASGKINRATVKKLPPALRGLAAYYSAVGGTKCTEHTCQLTTALGLGDQGSQKQIKLIQKYFPDDKVAKMLSAQNCYLPPDSSMGYSNFNSLSFKMDGENVVVNYQLTVYENGNARVFRGPDIYLFKNQVFREKKRVLYAWMDK